ncbi:MAG: NAD(P)/FAD-dependent oxidoreductase [Bacteroidetes bacterium]|nr:NAD(P)/FAD-dependent oxidoreductase [Bacteroidota bacterium]MCH8943071.1 NAD(P)/FAD-dependent oxidoreductase [Bacteroidota bacterium]
MSINYHHDVIIIGGGPAGSMAALYLSKYGLNTCIIEKKKFPREVLCGEFLSGEVSKTLKELNLFESFLSLNPVKISKFKFINEKGTEISSEFYFPAYALKRSLFDHFLLKSAVNIGVKVYQPAEAKIFKREGDKFLVQIKVSDDQEIIINSDYVIAAYGKQNILDKKLNRSFVGSETELKAIKFNIPNNCISNFPADEIRIYTGEGIYCGLNRVSEQETTLSFIEKRINGEQSPRNRILNLINANRKLGKLFGKDFDKLLYKLPIYGTGNIFFGKKTIVENGIFMIGDAAGVIAPLTGDGVGMAVQSAKLISSLLAGQKNRKYTRKELENIYLSEWNKLFLNRIRIAIFIQKLIITKIMNNFSFMLVKSLPFILPKLIHATRGI